MIKKIQKLKGFNIFFCDEQGNVYKQKVRRNKKTDNPENYLFPLSTQNENTSAPFVHLVYEGKEIALTIAKAILLAHCPEGYKKGLRAIRRDLNKPFCLSNLFWGTAEKQSEITMKNKKHFRRVKAMGKKFGKGNMANLQKFKKKNMDINPSVTNEINLLLKEGFSQSRVGAILGISRSSVSRHK